jgi:thiosulfate dehydrogenase [quinone] large subunit
MKHTLLGILRLLLGWIFLWPFLDKVFGLGFATESGKAWIDGISPTYGFLNFGTRGPFADFFQSFAGNPFVDWIFMIGLLGIGIALILGIGVRIAAVAGSIMLILMYVAVIPPEHNPYVDDHIIYAVVLILLAYTDSGKYIGFGKRWTRSKIVSKLPFLK